MSRPTGFAHLAAGTKDSTPAPHAAHKLRCATAPRALLRRRGIVRGGRRASPRRIELPGGTAPRAAGAARPPRRTGRGRAQTRVQFLPLSFRPPAPRRTRRARVTPGHRARESLVRHDVAARTARQRLRGTAIASKPREVARPLDLVTLPLTTPHLEKEAPCSARHLCSSWPCS